MKKLNERRVAINKQSEAEAKPSSKILNFYLLFVGTIYNLEKKE